MQQRMKKKVGATAIIAAGAATGAGLGAWHFITAPAMAAPAAPAAPVVLPDAPTFVDEDANLPPLPVEYVPMSVIQQDWKRRAALPKPLRDQAFMQPLLGGKPLPPSMQALPGAQPLPVPLGKAQTVASARMQNAPKTSGARQPSKATAPKSNSKQVAGAAKSASKNSATAASGSLDRALLAQARPIAPRAPGRTTPRFPQPRIAPFPVTSAVPPPRTIPTWVRYPLEFQMCGIGIGTRAVDKDDRNRIDRYGLFAMHGNPTAVVVPTGEGGGVTVTQTPPEVAALFPQDQDGGLPNWAAAITVGLDNNHVAWLYNRDTYAMSFVVDRLGFVDAIVVAGTYSPIAKTQLEDPVHTVQLGDDLRKVMFRYGYPDTIETYAVQAIAGAGTVTQGAGAGTATGGEGAATPEGGTPQTRAPQQQTEGGSGSGGEGGATGEGGAGGAGIAGNAGFRTFELRYEQSYNVVFTIRDNRVVRIYIFGDPDFFNLQRRRSLRTNY